MIYPRIIDFAIPCTDTGNGFFSRDRLDLILQSLSSSAYQLQCEMPLAIIYGHENFNPSLAISLISCHIDSIYDNYYANDHGDTLHGTFDNSACNAILVQAMLENILHPQTLIAFTGDEEYDSRGVDQSIEMLDHSDLFSQLEMVIVLDLTEEYYGKCPFTIENYCREKNHAGSKLAFATAKELKIFLKSILNNDFFIKNGDPDESWQYAQYDLNCFSLCLPCRILSEDMHADEGVEIRKPDVMDFLKALNTLTHGIHQQINQQNP